MQPESERIRALIQFTPREIAAGYVGGAAIRTVSCDRAQSIDDRPRLLSVSDKDGGLSPITWGATPGICSFHYEDN